MMFHFLNRHSKFFLTGLLTLGLSITACTQGQGPAEAPDKVTVAGTETPPQGAPPEDVCEKPENLDNILCQWVATQIENNLASQSKDIQKYSYDPKGRITQITAFDANGVQQGIGNLIYNDNGLWKLNYYSEPDPPGSENYTEEFRLVIDYFQPGMFKTKTIETLKNNVKIYSVESGYTPLQGNTIDSITAYRGASSTPIQIQYDRVTQDPATGNIQSVDRKIFSGATLNNPNSWILQTYGYDGTTGRLDTLTDQSQDCTSNPCSFTGNINATSTSETKFHYDDRQRETGYTQTTQGGAGSVDCEMGYEIQTQGKIVGIHPLEFMINTFSPVRVNFAVNDRDIFSSWTCKMGGQVESDARFKWARLWEVLPGGKPPGS